jgi:cbb3-type cytochrome oxidase subunit 3
MSAWLNQNLTPWQQTAAPAATLLFFLAVFVAVLLWIYRPGSARVYARSAALPLDDEPSASASTPRETTHG